MIITSGCLLFTASSLLNDGAFFKLLVHLTKNKSFLKDFGGASRKMGAKYLFSERSDGVKLSSEGYQIQDTEVSPKPGKKVLW